MKPYKIRHRDASYVFFLCRMQFLKALEKRLNVRNEQNIRFYNFIRIIQNAEGIV